MLIVNIHSTFFARYQPLFMVAESLLSHCLDSHILFNVNLLTLHERQSNFRHIIFIIIRKSTLQQLLVNQQKFNVKRQHILYVYFTLS